MNFDFAEEQESLRQSLRRFLENRYSFEQRTNILSSAKGMSDEVWVGLVKEFALGDASCLSAGEQASFIGPVERMIIMEELGRALVVEPYLESAVIGAALLARCSGDEAAATLGKVASGDLTAVLAWAEPTLRDDFADIACTADRSEKGWVLNGEKTVVMGAPWADYLLVAARTSGVPGDSGGLSVFGVPKESEGLEIFGFPTADAKCAADILLTNVEVEATALLGNEGEAHKLLEEVRDHAIMASCAEAIGVMQRLINDTIEYTNQRRQFGRTLADFQALQHRMVDMYKNYEMAKSALYRATIAAHMSADERALAASSAKVTVSTAAQFVGENAVQLHGGMGMTDELAIGHGLRKLTVFRGQFGSSDFHTQRYAALSRKAAA